MNYKWNVLKKLENKYAKREKNVKAVVSTILKPYAHIQSTKTLFVHLIILDAIIQLVLVFMIAVMSGDLKHDHAVGMEEILQ